MSDLAEFLLARIAEDEAAAEAAPAGQRYTPPHHGRKWCVHNVDASHVVIPITGPRGPTVARTDYPAQADHIARWDPARVLAECDAKQRIVENHAQRFEAGGELHDAQTLRLLALPYADHPDYLEEWRP